MNGNQTAPITVDPLLRLGKLVLRETRQAVRKKPDAEKAAIAVRLLLDRLSGLSLLVEFRQPTSAEFVRLFQQAYAGAKEALTEDYLSLIVVDGRSLCEFAWPGTATLEGATYCEILVFDIAAGVHQGIADASDFDGHAKAVLAGKDYKLKPKAVLKA